MPIKFRCPDCRAKIKVSEEYAGQMGVCPTCRKRTTIPLASDPEFAVESGAKSASAIDGQVDRKASAVQPAAQDAPAPASQNPPVEDVASDVPQAPVQEVQAESKGEPEAEAPKNSGGKAAAVKSAPAFIKFKCPNCEKPTGFPSTLIGKPVACPLCHMQIMVPEENGGDSFVVGAMPPAAKVTRGASARALGSRVATALPENATSATSAPARTANKPPWALIAVGGAILLVLAIVVGILIGGMGKSSQPEQQAAASAPQTAAAQPVTSPQTTPTVPPPISPREIPPTEPATPYLPPVATPTENPAAPTTAPGAQQPEPPPETADPAKEKAEPPPPTDPTALIPDSLPRRKAGSDEDEAPATAGSNTSEALQGLLDGPKNQDTPAAPVVPTEPTTITPVPKPPPCAKCLGCGYLPLPNLRPYVYVYGERPPDPATVVPWVYCDQCMKDHENKSLPALEAERFTRSMAMNKRWDDIFAATKTKLVHVETRHLLLHCELPPQVAKQVATTLDKLTQLLQSRSRSCLLTLTRPDTHEMVILGTDASYNNLITELEKTDPGSDWAMSRKSTGFSFTKLAVYNAANSGASGPEPMAIHQFSKMLIHSACDGHVPPWLSQGFASYCENQLTHRNLCYTFSYELNDVKFGENWNQDIRKFALQGQLKQWNYIFPMDLIGLKALDYLTCYSMVSFFMGDAQRFCKMVAEVRDGTQSGPAIVKIYGRPIKDLQGMWANWAVQQR